MKTLFIGSSHISDLDLYAIASDLPAFDSYVGVGGSSIIAAALACKIDKEDVILLLKSLQFITKEYGWNEKNCLALLQNTIPRGNTMLYQKILKKTFGDLNLVSVPLGVVAYNVTQRKVSLLRGVNLTVVEAIMIATGRRQNGIKGLIRDILAGFADSHNRGYAGDPRTTSKEQSVLSALIQKMEI